MPCRSYDDVQIESPKVQSLKAKLDNVTRLLCGVMTIIEQEKKSLFVESKVDGLKIGGISIRKMIKCELNLRKILLCRN